MPAVSASSSTKAYHEAPRPLEALVFLKEPESSRDNPLMFACVASTK